LAGDEQKMMSSDTKTDVVFGNLPSALLADDIEKMEALIKSRASLEGCRKVSLNGFKRALLFKFHSSSSVPSHKVCRVQRIVWSCAQTP
jgi:uncharacterized protein (UPF0248 family)